MDTQEVDEENKLAKGEWIFYKLAKACIALQLLQQMAKLKVTDC
jgi:hypothetical protein